MLWIDNYKCSVSVFWKKMCSTWNILTYCLLSHAFLDLSWWKDLMRERLGCCSCCVFLFLWVVFFFIFWSIDITGAAIPSLIKKKKKKVNTFDNIICKKGYWITYCKYEQKGSCSKHLCLYSNGSINNLGLNCIAEKHPSLNMENDLFLSVKMRRLAASLAVNKSTYLVFCV